MAQFNLKQGTNGKTGLTHVESGLKMNVPGIASNDTEAIALIRAAQNVTVRGGFKGQTFNGRASSTFLGTELADMLTGKESKGKGKGKGKESANDTLADDILNERNANPANV